MAQMIKKHEWNWKKVKKSSVSDFLIPSLFPATTPLDKTRILADNMFRRIK